MVGHLAGHYREVQEDPEGRALLVPTQEGTQAMSDRMTVITIIVLVVVGLIWMDGG